MVISCATLVFKDSTEPLKLIVGFKTYEKLRYMAFTRVDMDINTMLSGSDIPVCFQGFLCPNGRYFLSENSNHKDHVQLCPKNHIYEYSFCVATFFLLVLF